MSYNMQRTPDSRAPDAGPLFDGITRHTQEGFKKAVRQRDEPFGDFGMKTFKG